MHPRTLNRCFAGLIVALTLASTGTAAAGTVVVVADRDTTLYAEDDFTSNGAGDHLFAGQTAMGDARRGLLHFDLSAIAPGTTVLSATLTLNMSRTVTGPQPVTLHRLTNDWGEAGSDAPGQEGGGAPAMTGDATWVFRFFDSVGWDLPGGDFAAIASASQMIDANGFYTWGTSPEMVADVGSWIDDPAINLGWILLGDEAGAAVTAKRFDTHENSDPAVAPTLTLVLEAPSPFEIPTLSALGLIFLTVACAGAALRLASRRRLRD